MEPAEICKRVLGPERLNAIFDELSSPQVKAVLKEGGLKTKLAGGFVSQARRRQIWAGRVLSAIEADSHATAAELLQQWLLNHRRSLLIAFLDGLQIKHRQGETDESFLLSGSRERILEEARKLAAEHEAAEVAAYLHYIAYQQRSKVFEGWEPSASVASGSVDCAPDANGPPPDAAAGDGLAAADDSAAADRPAQS